jgi:DNA-binding MarR family transcriptional regulator
MTSALDQVSLPQYRVLLVLCEYGTQRSGDLAEIVGVHQSTLTRTADRLVALGFITREVSPDSRREVLIGLTDEGRQLVLDVMRARRGEVGALLESLRAPERARIARGMALFAQAAGEPPQDVLRTLGV